MRVPGAIAQHWSAALRACGCRGNVGEILDQKDQRGVKAALLRDLDLEQVQQLWPPILLHVSWDTHGLLLYFWLLTSRSLITVVHDVE
jgi:hypothetical protein